jgi:hypothetical protein
MPHTVSVKKLLPNEFSPLVCWRSGYGPFVLGKTSKYSLCQTVVVICSFSVYLGLQVFAAVLSSGPTRRKLNASYKTADNSSFQVNFH